MPTKSPDSVMCDVCVVFALVGGDLIGNRRFRTHDLPGETQIGQGADNMSRFSGRQTHFHLEDTSRTHMMMGIYIRRAAYVTANTRAANYTAISPKTANFLSACILLLYHIIIYVYPADVKRDNNKDLHSNYDFADVLLHNICHMMVCKYNILYTLRTYIIFFFYLFVIYFKIKKV